MKTAGNHRWAGIVRAIWSLVATATLLIAPLLITATHGPGAYAQALEVVAADLAQGHSHDLHGDGSSQHDATDHEHQVTAILVPPGKSAFDRHPLRLPDDATLTDGRSREGPRRPPRAVLI